MGRCLVDLPSSQRGLGMWLKGGDFTCQKSQLMVPRQVAEGSRSSRTRKWWPISRIGFAWREVVPDLTIKLGRFVTDHTPSPVEPMYAPPARRPVQ